MRHVSELEVHAQTNDIVRARVGLLSVGCLLVVVAVETDEVAGIQADLLVDVPCTAQSDGVAVAGEGGVLLVTVGESVVGALTTTADGELVVDVVLYTCQELVGAVGQLLLAILRLHVI